MKGKSFSAGVRMKVLRSVEAGASVKDICRQNQIAEQTIRRWRRELGNMAVSENLRREEQEQKNRELRKLLVNSLLIDRTLGAVSVQVQEYTTPPFARPKTGQWCPKPA
jgi:putative transposase